MQFHGNCADQKNRWRLAAWNYRRAVPVPRKVRKTAFFVNQTPCLTGMAPGGQLGAARRFLLFQEPRNPPLALAKPPTLLGLPPLQISPNPYLNSLSVIRILILNPFIRSFQYNWTINLLRTLRTQFLTLTSSSHCSIKFSLQSLETQ